MNDFRVREARRADVETIGVLWQELMALHSALDPRFVIAEEGERVYRQHIQEMIRSREGHVLLAEAMESGTENGAIVGYMQGQILARSALAPPGVQGLISDVFVRAEWRKRGVGRALYTEMRLWFVERKVQTLQLYVAAENPEALAFWRSVGMQPYMHVLQQELSPLVSPSLPLSKEDQEEDRNGQSTPKWRGLFRTKPGERD